MGRFTAVEAAPAVIPAFARQQHQGRDVDEIAEVLNTLFQLFDRLADEHKVEKIKTICDANICVSGLPERCDDHAERMARMAITMSAEIRKVFDDKIRIRFGIHSKEVIAGVLGKNKYANDLWDDTVNTASRMESHGLP